MTMGIGALVAAAPFVAAWVMLSRTLRASHLLRVAAAVGLALGLTSIAWFLFRIAGLPLGVYVIVELLVVAAMLRHWRAASSLRVVPRGRPRWTTADIALAAYVAAAVAAASLVFARTMMAHPYGSSDAWAMWMLKAAFLAEPSAAWRDGFAAGTELPHVDYPLLLPGAIARVAHLTGDLALSAHLVAIVTLAGIVLAVGGAVRQRSGAMMAAAAVALLLAPEFVSQSAMLNADLLVGFYALLAIALLQWSDDASPRGSALGGSVERESPAVPPATSKTTILAGFFAGCAAWTKNEGLIVAGAVVIYLGWRWLRGRERAATLTHLLIGLWPMLVLVTLFKLWTPANDLVDGVLAPGAWQRWLDTVRVAFVWREMWRGLWMWGPWWIAPPVLLVVLAAVVPRVGAAFEPRARSARPALGLVLLALQLTAFFVVYVMTPHSVAWHVGTSWPRLIAQMWPIMVLMAVRDRGAMPQSARIMATVRARTINLLTVLAIGIGAFVVRLVTIWNTRDAGVYSDMIEYNDRALALVQQGLAAGLYSFNAWRTPAYPLFLWAHYSAFGVDYLAPRIGQAVLGGLCAVLTYLLARQLVDRRRSAAAACVAAIYPASILFSVYLASETLFTFLLLAGLWCWLVARGTSLAALAGVCFGVATMTRAAGLVGLVAMAASVPALVRAGGRPLRRQTLAALVCFLVVIAPWTYRNYQMYDRFIPIDTNGGFNFLVGNHPEATGRFEWNYQATLPPQYYPEATTDLEVSDQGYAHGMAYIRSNPGAFLRLVPAKLAHLWGLEGREHVWLTSVSYFGALTSSAVWTWGVAVLTMFPALMSAAVIGIFRPGLIASPTGAAIVGVLVALSALHAISFGEARFHLPVVPLLAILAARATASDAGRAALSGPRIAAIAAILLLLCITWAGQVPLLFERLSAVAGAAPTPSPLIY